jgi:hypothetical protein
MSCYQQGNHHNQDQEKLLFCHSFQGPIMLQSQLLVRTFAIFRIMRLAITHKPKSVWRWHFIKIKLTGNLLSVNIWMWIMAWRSDSVLSSASSEILNYMAGFELISTKNRRIRLFFYKGACEHYSWGVVKASLEWWIQVNPLGQGRQVRGRYYEWHHDNMSTCYDPYHQIPILNMVAVLLW